VMAARRHAEGREIARRMARLEERVRLRPLVYAAVQGLMADDGCCEGDAYDALRREAMRRRITLEQTAAAILARPRRQVG